MSTKGGWTQESTCRRWARRGLGCWPCPFGEHRWRAALGRLDLASGHLPFATAFAAELMSDFKAGAGALDREFPLHLGEAGHYVKKEVARGGAGVDRVGEALELHALLMKFADKVHQPVFLSRC